MSGKILADGKVWDDKDLMEIMVTFFLERKPIKAIQCKVTTIVNGIFVSCTNSLSIDDVASAAGMGKLVLIIFLINT